MGVPPLQAVIDWHTVIENARAFDGRDQARAWACIYASFEKELRALIKTLTGGRWWLEIEDLLQEILLRVRRDFDGFAVQGNDARKSLKNWIYTVARHHVINRIHERAPEVASDEAVEQAEARATAEPLTRHLVEQMMEGVPKEDAYLSFLRGVEELSYAEIVTEIEAFRAREALPATTGLSEDGLRVRWQRLRERFKTFMRDKITGPWQARNEVKA